MLSKTKEEVNIKMIMGSTRPRTNKLIQNAKDEQEEVVIELVCR